MSNAAASRPARARLGPWPHERDVVHLVLLDHQMVPDAAQVDEWEQAARAAGGHTIRTGALFAVSTRAFLDVGYHVADTLTLLERRLDHTSARGHRIASGLHLRRLRPAMLHEAATVDQRCFSVPWSNDATTLAEIMGATPQHRSRAVYDRGRMVAFSISGRAYDKGYIQRLAVDPSARRRGFAALLVDDAISWMRRRGVTTAMVNTAADNAPALALYRSAGFEATTEPLVILERELDRR